MIVKGESFLREIAQNKSLGWEKLRWFQKNRFLNIFFYKNNFRGSRAHQAPFSMLCIKRALCRLSRGWFEGESVPQVPPVTDSFMAFATKAFWFLLPSALHVVQQMQSARNKGIKCWLLTDWEEGETVTLFWHTNNCHSCAGRFQVVCTWKLFEWAVKSMTGWWEVRTVPTTRMTVTSRRENLSAGWVPDVSQPLSKLFSFHPESERNPWLLDVALWPRFVSGMAEVTQDN